MKNKKLIVTFILIILANAAGVSLWLYLHSEIEKQKANIREIAGNLAFSGANTKNLKMLKNQAEEEVGNKTKLDETILVKKDIVPFMEYLEKTGKGIGVSVDFSSVNIGEIGKEKPRLQFSLKGKFENIYRFIVLLENVRYQIVLDQMILRKNGDGGGWEANAAAVLASYNGEK